MCKRCVCVRLFFCMYFAYFCASIVPIQPSFFEHPAWSSLHKCYSEAFFASSILLKKIDTHKWAQKSTREQESSSLCLEFRFRALLIHGFFLSFSVVFKQFCIIKKFHIKLFAEFQIMRIQNACSAAIALIRCCSRLRLLPLPCCLPCLRSFVRESGSLFAFKYSHEYACVAYGSNIQNCC